jgi:hypothetical protein
MAAAGIAGALGLALAAQAQEVPKQRVGLWRSDMVMAGQSISAKSCVDAASAARMSIFSSSIRRSDKCQQLQLSHNPDGSWTSVSRCEIRPGAPETSRADVSGDFNSRIVMTLRSPPTAKPEMTATMTWIGPCGPGMRGGDVMMADGTKVNVDPAP